jgi:hypothetical protein
MGIKDRKRFWWVIYSSFRDAALSLEHRRRMRATEEGTMEQEQAGNANAGEPLDEARRVRRLQLMMDLVMQVIAQDPKLTFEEASQMVADSRAAALAMFPGKELAYDLLYRPRFQRLMSERFRLH